MVGEGSGGALVQRAQMGDRVAFAELYLEFFDPIYRHLYETLTRSVSAPGASRSF